MGRFWRPSGNLVPIAGGDAFLAFDEPGIAKLALGFMVTGRQNRGAVLATETRVFCPDRASRMRFTPYWHLIRPFSGLIRHRILSVIKGTSEKGVVATS